jgi:hypothetical protein
MQFTVWLFGCEVFAVRVGPEDQPESGPGDCTATPVGFTARFDRPDEADLPDRS